MRTGVALACVVAVATGCRFGEATFTSNLSDRGFDPSGTVFAYVDAEDDALVEDPDRDPPVAVAMTWLVFDPSSDLGDLDGAALASYEHEVRLRDALSLVFAEQSSVEPSAELESIRKGKDGAEEGDGRMTAFVHLAPERLSAASTYADFVPFASRRVVRVEIDQADFRDARFVSGRVDVIFERTDADPADVREGTITGTFRAPLVEERVAERNLALLDVSDTLGLPLTPPAEPTP